MGKLRDFFYGKEAATTTTLTVYEAPSPPEPPAKTAEDILANFPGGTYYDLGTYNFNGEKNLGGIGPMIDYHLDFNGLAIRSWQAMLESDKAQIAIKRLITWVIGNGLRPQSQPVISVLENNGIKIDKQKFSKSVEDGWNMFRGSKCASYNGMKNLNELSQEAEKNSMIGGDMLVIIRYVRGEVKVQHIDRMNVCSPFYGSQYFPQALANGNSIVDGVEINSKREHVAFYVRTYALSAEIGKLFEYKFERIPAKNPRTGMTTAFLYYGDQHRIDNMRGLTILAACLEKLKRMEEYSDAALDQAKEAAKVSYQQVTELNGSGKATWSANSVRGYNNGNGPTGSGTNQLPIDSNGTTLNRTLNVTSIGMAYNNEPGSEIKMLSNENPLYFKEFDEVHSNCFFAVIGIPPNVAMMLYNDSYSASRASQMDWVHILLTKWEHHKVGYLDYIFAFWLDVQILKGNIQAPGYLLARAQGNTEVIQAYRGIRFIGTKPAQIDPKKEIEAARLVMGTSFDHVPFSDMENVAEGLDLGIWNESIVQAAEELDTANALKIKPIPMEQKVVDGSGKKKPTAASN